MIQMNLMCNEKIFIPNGVYMSMQKYMFIGVVVMAIFGFQEVIEGAQKRKRELNEVDLEKEKKQRAIDQKERRREFREKREEIRKLISETEELTQEQVLKKAVECIDKLEKDIEILKSQTGITEQTLTNDLQRFRYFNLMKDVGNGVGAVTLQNNPDYFLNFDQDTEI